MVATSVIVCSLPLTAPARGSSQIPWPGRELIESPVSSRQLFGLLAVAESGDACLGGRVGTDVALEQIGDDRERAGDTGLDRDLEVSLAPAQIDVQLREPRGNRGTGSDHEAGARVDGRAAGEGVDGREAGRWEE